MRDSGTSLNHPAVEWIRSSSAAVMTAGTGPISRFHPARAEAAQQDVSHRPFSIWAGQSDSLQGFTRCCPALMLACNLKTKAMDNLHDKLLAERAGSRAIKGAVMPCNDNCHAHLGMSTLAGCTAVGFRAMAAPGKPGPIG
ncbi:hypothetical protein PCANC_14534 [Puccinia coronata f. sp. avenae]|uniref:Uncharacterized protein n=1 Tax=Puccinia coronata f. sp. avenae TaxID=200324 RepID=A0A2N5SQP1_9BASI|nr:hypothetical protein PCANC_14534 [Puccinia coronata f. sp. avenae]PLW34351.1 hypothetical protein PCASD_10595 [Puccinia coronata f. sp. avenae]